jgi:hypothetical protein
MICALIEMRQQALRVRGVAPFGIPLTSTVGVIPSAAVLQAERGISRASPVSQYEKLRTLVISTKESRRIILQLD